MTIRRYSSLDSGAPVISGNATVQTALRTILMACLVNGYGGKAPAGWAVGHDVTNGFSLGNGDGYVAFVYSNDIYSIVYCMESITDGSTTIPGGVNRRSGPWFDGQTTTTRQYLRCSNAASSAVWYWSVVADGATVHLSLYRYTATISPAYLSFGRYLPAGGFTGPASFGVFGGSNNTNTYNFGQSSSSDSYAGTALRNPFTGLIDQGASPYYGVIVPNVCSSSAVVDRAKNVVDQILQQPALVMAYGAGLSSGTGISSAVYAGRPRGMVSDALLASISQDDIAEVLGYTYSNARENMVSLITLPNGKEWSPFALGTANAANTFISMDEADWS